MSLMLTCVPPFHPQIHEIRELGVKEDNMVSQHGGKGSSEKPEGEEEVEAGKGLGLPSPYCTV
jgi:hypothetical protein